ncbi:MAG TPA: hypothetical protein VLN57_13520 [Xanthobacteraceae bacterium]|nr:hypothetical protein [Xanthobacteraceae bacterium]
MTEELHRWENLGHCPDCGCNEFEPGPRGGVSVNRRCVGCGAWWNAVVEVGLIQRIRDDEPKQPGRAITAEQWRSWAWLDEISEAERDQWVLAPSALNYQQAEEWALAAGCSKIICLSSGDTLVRING